ncbi:MAG: HNH endonuclease [Halobacteriovorax sp.]|nr:HNH endonuclease [Halobacteriovorax sp.]|tara:strand:- start:328673 stop:329698 length:1026 start_codon:yes stop_codon:yes gene_type:complete
MSDIGPREKEVFYRNEKYSVRDDGSVYRHERKGKRPRPNDCKWTFGKESKSHPYLSISGQRVHRIVATAFHGNPPESDYVVDHIDTNCRNNRPENLRWVTRLENSLNNPATRKKIEYLCGSIEAFLDSPSMLNDRTNDRSFSWMRTVTKEEAQNCKKRMTIWANSNIPESKYQGMSRDRRDFNKRVYKPLSKFDVGFGREPGLDISKTLWCATYMFISNKFFLCPEKFKKDRLEEYFQNIRPGELFSETQKVEDYPDYYYSMEVVKSEIRREKNSIIVLCKRSNNTFMNVGIELYEKNNWFIHNNLGVYSCEDEARGAFTSLIKIETSEFSNLSFKNQMNL